MIASASPTLDDALRAYLRSRWLKPSTIGLYSIAVRLFESWHGGSVILRELSSEMVMGWMRWLAETRGPQTVNSKRRALLTIIRSAREFPKVPRMPEVRRAPTAWRPHEMAAILAECDRTALRHKRHRSIWGPIHFRALALQVYDTSLRIGCLLLAKREACDLKRKTLLIPGELMKGRADALHRLSDQACEAIAALPPNSMLNPWPMRREQLWKWWGRILARAGLPATRRDKFHRIRRTSYSHVRHKLGPEAASRHASHRVDLSAFYYDPTIFEDHPDPLSVLPRP